MDIIFGTNTIMSSLKLGSVKKLYLANGYNNEKVLSLAKHNNVNIVYVQKSELDKMTHGGVHQNVVGVIKNKELLSLDNLLEKIKNIKNPLLVMLDELNDPHNLGAILRSGDAFSIDGIIFKSNNQVALTETVAKVSTGAINFVPCVQVVNLTNTIKTLKKNGFWVIGLDGSSSSTLKNIPSDVPLCLVVGSEGFGISRLVKENCDMLVKIPMTGHVDCLNASVACSIALYQIRNR